ncbi:MAG: 4-(cytidine 5'-diphospho)-2-C-methyl-D-erythritol kinase [Planctomycetes bacterium]|nr:4-(cytidine 5'-diphospho)-2-C-methyl-D-erythritol kinase [Planctomycetota bacterium]
MNYKVVRNNLRSIELLAPAKINLFLSVGKKRRDGFHGLVTLMQEVSLHDRVRIRLRAGNSIRVTVVPAVKGVPSGRKNLVCKAAEAFFRHTGLKTGIEITVIKKVPAGAGLGGGSSDAASTLIGLDCLLKTALGRKKLSEIAAEIGSDVPFFIYGRTALCRGRGEIVEPFALRGKLYYVIVFPNIAVSTKLIYENFDLHLTKDVLYGKIIVLKYVNADSISGSLLFNSLEPVAFRLFPRLETAAQVMRACGGFKGVLLSGSGSAIYGLCRNKEMAIKTAEILKRRLGRYMEKKSDIFVAQTL